MADVETKICGVTRVDDALDAVEAGATWIGVNVVPSSPRFVEDVDARKIAEALRGRAVSVAVVADRPVEELRALLEIFDRVQLHGHEPPAVALELGPRAYPVARIAAADDVARARALPGPFVLLDAKSPLALGGTGSRFDWSLVVELARERPIGLAGGLTPENVADAVRLVRPRLVDVASGVEAPGAPRRKDPARVRAFLAAVRSVNDE